MGACSLVFRPVLRSREPLRRAAAEGRSLLRALSLPALSKAEGSKRPVEGAKEDAAESFICPFQSQGTPTLVLDIRVEYTDAA